RRTDSTEAPPGGFVERIPKLRQQNEAPGCRVWQPGASSVWYTDKGQTYLIRVAAVRTHSRQAPGGSDRRPTGRMPGRRSSFRGKRLSIGFVTDPCQVYGPGARIV